MSDARIIRLGPSTQVARVVNFNDAFVDTEVSNIFGLGKSKAQRQEKKKAKIQARKEKKLARIQARNEVRSARQAGRQERRAGRQAARTEKALMRQDRKSLKSQARQQRRTDRKGMRLNRRQMGDEVIDDQNLEMEDQGYQPDSGYESQNYDYGYEDQGQEGQYEDGGYEDEGGYPEDTNEEDYGSEVDFGEEEYYPEYEDDSDIYNFDGISKDDDPSKEFADDMDITEVPSGVQSIADKLEWNREYVVRLDAKKNDILVQAPDADIDSIEDMKIQKEDRISGLKQILKGFVNFDGDIDPRGEYVQSAETIDIGADGAGLMLKKRQRARMVKKAIDNARSKRPRRRPTMVDSDLNPNIDQQRIEIPAGNTMSNASGTGLIGLDDQNDFDAPDKLDIQLGADGSKNMQKIAVIGIGVGVGLLAIHLVNKYYFNKK